MTSSAALRERRSAARVSARTRARRFSSRLEKGSSSSTTEGRGASARARATRCCSPPESSCGRREPRWGRPTSSSDSATRAARAARGSPSSPKATLRSTSRWGNRAWSWKTMPTRRRSGGRCRWPSSTTSPPTPTTPASECSRPATSRSSVDLPQPEGPTTVTTSPGATSRSSPRTASTAP
ncbi:hypothetical protein ASG49_04850 [Marmoricola sp. Leaf446]|nr:hypothetical protein ASG49_04850 [Marmoricola sp. Leaf446]